ncbi:DGQHR domain-containing protein [Paenibacillus planticolens]|uniref:DGQHR domain-containing protein n=1 Tax=Paenibacillus planticolens TaxID=2654976 RepID=A0ABX1ZJG3_9BACL|nr:DGQHR domain-containing protein [Paenibacillus planticolens]NOU99102.1 DGQHR domain-containing protein [Paenibacillus planticolens]
MSEEKIALSANLVQQGVYRFYICSMPSDTLGETCFVTTRAEAPEEGFQRRLDESRADLIADYIDQGKGSIPTAIILSAQEDAHLKYNSKNKTIVFEKFPLAFKIIDGQHRVFGFKKTKTIIRVPVIIYDGLTLQEEAKLFLDINTTQKPVSEALILDVKRLLDTESEQEKICSELFELFYTQVDSQLLNKLARSESANGKISRKMFNQCIEPILPSLKTLSLEQAYKVLNAYLKAFQTTFSQIEQPLSGAILRPVIFQAILSLFNDILSKNNIAHKSISHDNFCNVLSCLKTNLSKRSIQKPGNSYKSLAEKISHALNQVYIPAHMIIE